MLDFKDAFDVVEKDPDYFLGCAIEWDPETGVIQLDASKYLREVIAKFDMVGAHPSPIPAPVEVRRFIPTKIGMAMKNSGTYISNIAVASTMQH
jgi:hypothetical protein